MYPPFDPTVNLGAAYAQAGPGLRIPMPGGGQAILGANGVSDYRRPNWQGSQPVDSSPTGTVLSDAAYTPFGEHYDQNGGYSGFYAGNLSIWPTLMDGYAALYRLYHFDQGRWVSPDPAGLSAVDATNPQSWNRYAYWGNNPAGSVDPSRLVFYCPYGTIPGMNACAPPPYTTFYITSCSQAQLLDSSIICGPPTFGSPPATGAGGSSNPQYPCSYKGNAMAPNEYGARGTAASINPIASIRDLREGFSIGGYLDAQPLASGNVFQRAAYGNYVYGVYMAAAGFPLWVALSGANGIAGIHKMSNPSQYNGRQMDSTWTNLPVQNVANSGLQRREDRAHMSLTRGTLVVMVVTGLLLLVACQNLERTWFAEARSPDGRFVGRAETLEPRGWGTDAAPETYVEVNWTSGSQKPTVILSFTKEASGPTGMRVVMRWTSPTHLDLTYEGSPRIDFKAVKWGDVEISAHSQAAQAERTAGSDSTYQRQPGLGAML